MKVIENNIIPFKGFAAINLFGVLFVRKGIAVSERLLRHETIHTEQMKELTPPIFYIWYVVEWLIRLLMYRTTRKAYRNISFEREAYENDDKFIYLKERKPFAFLKYVFVIAVP